MMGRGSGGGGFRDKKKVGKNENYKSTRTNRNVENTKRATTVKSHRNCLNPKPDTKT